MAPRAGPTSPPDPEGTAPSTAPSAEARAQQAGRGGEGGEKGGTLPLAGTSGEAVGPSAVTTSTPLNAVQLGPL